jgi:hypothetical protein
MAAPPGEFREEHSLDAKESALMQRSNLVIAVIG